MKGRVWTEIEDNYLKEHYHNKLSSEIGKKLDRTIRAVFARASNLKLKKDPEFLLETNKALAIKLQVVGKKYRFKKGLIPANKGKKMPPEFYDLAKHTFFKRGHTPANKLPIGAIQTRHRYSRDIPPYNWIKIGEPNKWQMLHVYNWEKVNGPAPKGMCVVFKNKNTLDCNISNLELITRKENMRRNTIQRYPTELKQTIRLVGKLKRTINGKKQNTRST